MSQTKISGEQIITAIEGMTVLELNTLVKSLEEKFGVSAAAMVAAAPAAGGAAAAGAPASEEKTEFTVILKNGGAQKIGVIKEVRAITNLGLKEAKELVEGGNKPVKEKISKQEADEIKQKLEAVGATVEIQ